jgi:hypothetical protein
MKDCIGLDCLKGLGGEPQDINCDDGCNCEECALSSKYDTRADAVLKRAHETFEKVGPGRATRAELQEQVQFFKSRAESFGRQKEYWKRRDQGSGIKLYDQENRIKALEADRDTWKELAQLRYKSMCDLRLEVKELHQLVQRNGQHYNKLTAERAAQILDLMAENKKLRKMTETAPDTNWGGE